MDVDPVDLVRVRDPDAVVGRDVEQRLAAVDGTIQGAPVDEVAGGHGNGQSLNIATVAPSP